MAAINFPDSPSNGDTHTVGGVTYTYNSAETKWKTTINSNAFLPLTGGTLSGNLTLGSNQLTAGGLTYPTSDGTTGQYLQTNGSGTLSFATVATPTVAFDAYAIIVDQKPATTNGGTFTGGDWRTRDLNTELSDPDGIVSISSNQFTLQAGSYLIRWACPAYYINRHQSRLYDVTNATVREYGLSGYTASGGYSNNYSTGSARVVPGAATTYEIQHHASGTLAGSGFGVYGGAGVEQYTLVEIFREA